MRPPKSSRTRRIIDESCSVAWTDSGACSGLSAVILAAQVVGACLELIYGYEQILFMPERALPGIRGDLNLPAHDDCFFGAGFFAITTEHASRHVDVEDFRITLDLVVGFGRKNRDTRGRSRPFTQTARDTSFLAIFHLHQHRHAPN